ncbi:TolC family protein, partial [Patescibacteria group bacterium]|nr:TolC family protein [Patescibacteria group bacterium]
MRRSLIWFLTARFPLSGGLLLTCFSLLLPIGSAFSDDIVEIVSVQVEPTPEGASIEIRSNRPFHFVTYTLTDPYRLVVDPVVSEISSSFSQIGGEAKGLIEAWHIFNKVGAENPDQLDYLSFELSQDAEHQVEIEQDRIRIRVRPKKLVGQFGPIQSLIPTIPLAASPALSSNMLLAQKRLEVKNRSQVMPLDRLDGDNLWNVNTAILFGLSRHRPLRIARQEVALAQMKIREARRALYPAVTLRSTWTAGTASEVNFTEFSSGFRLEQPIYYSGQLRQTFQQSLINLQVAEKRQTKVKADAAFDIIEAYYQWVGAKVSYLAQDDLLEKVDDLAAKARKRFDIGLLTRLELLNVEAQSNQAHFQRMTAENDAFLARLKFFKELRLSNQVIIDIPADFPV